MITKLKPYPAYKDSGVEWLDKVPEHWEVRRLRASVTGCINGMWGNEPNGIDDIICVRVADFDRTRLRVRMDQPTLRAIKANDRHPRLLKPGDLLLEKSGEEIYTLSESLVLYDHSKSAVCSNFIARMPVAKSFNSVYLTYLHSQLYKIRLNVRSIKQTTGIQNLDSSQYLNEKVVFPPLSEQNTIVRFLDYVDRRVRRVIRLRQKRIKLLEEYKQALIHQAVTGQIDVQTGKPYPAYKDSGVEWLGKVPEHWEVRRLKSSVLHINEQTNTKKSDELYIALEHVESWTGRLWAPSGDVEFDSQVKRFRAGDVLLESLDHISQRLFGRTKMAFV